MKAIRLTVSDSGPPIVAVRNLRVNRGGRPVLHRLSCDVPRGKISALVGLNGSGKTTLLRTLLGEFPSQGEIRFACGEDHSRPFEHLTPADRQAILEIVRDTRPGLPAYWRK